MNLITIVPVESGPGEIQKTQGTQVILSDGSQLGGVSKIELVAEINDVWRAVIHCQARVLPITARTEDFVDGYRDLPRWRYWLLRMAGFMVAQQPASKRVNPEFDGTAHLFDRGRS